MIKLITAIILISGAACFAQTDWERWEAKAPDYTINKSYVTETESGGGFAGTLQKAYRFLISDLDGDNCPFHPSCSSFFVQSVNETNIFQGILMFFDRFQRDINFFKGFNHYPIYKTGKFYDPIINYTLDYSKIKYLQGGTTVK